MINALSLAGAALVLGGLALVLLGIGKALVGVFRRHVYRKKPLVVEGQGVWSGAVTAREVYVPGTIVRKLGLAAGGVLLLVLGAPLAWAGISLGDYSRLEQPTPLARVEAGGGRLRIESGAGAPVEGAMPGSVLAAHAEYVTFSGWPVRLGLGAYGRLTRVSGYASSADVLSRRGLARLDVAPPHPLFAILERVARLAPGTVATSRRVSPPLRPHESPAELWASADGLEWRR